MPACAPSELGKQVIVFTADSTEQTVWAGRPGMPVVQALHWLRDALTNPDDYRQILRQLRTILADKDQGHAIATDLATGLPTLPAWMQDVLRRLLAGDNDATRRAPSHAAA